MTSQHNKPKRWRPRFSVRTLAVLVTLVCAYAACWGPTKRYGVRDLWDISSEEARPVVPFVLARDRVEYDFGLTSGAPLTLNVPQAKHVRKRCYYFWFFGYVAKLPYEREVEIDTKDFLPLPVPIE